MIRRVLVMFTVFGLGYSLALAGGPEQARVDKAIEKGAAWVKGRQSPDGTWKDRWASAYASGETALSLLTLLKCGTKPEDPSIQKGFDWLLEQPFKKTYDVAVSILAVEALYSPKESPDANNPYRTVVRKAFNKNANGRVKDWLERATHFIASNQRDNGEWGYPGQDADLSNTQFALLALKASHRMGIKVEQDLWIRVATYLVDKQEKQGNKIEDFDVPAADNNIDDVEDRKAAQKIRERREKESGTRERPKNSMQARGFRYKESWIPRGSMTAAGTACLVVCKSELENNAAYEKKLAPAVDKGIRDGSAWLADRFKSDQNPGAEADWLFYYLYTVERAGTLTGCARFGNHDWYGAGAEQILNRQKDDGHFEEGTKGELDGMLAGTCLALLFLKRATVPVIDRTATGVPGAEQQPTAGAIGGGGDKRLGVSIEKLADGNYAVTFRLKPSGSPTKVSVAGTFNGWSKDSNPLALGSDGVYEATVRMLPQKISYKFVLDGNEWILDPSNSASEDDGHGNRNSVFTIG